MDRQCRVEEGSAGGSEEVREGAVRAELHLVVIYLPNSTMRRCSYSCVMAKETEAWRD